MEACGGKSQVNGVRPFNRFNSRVAGSNPAMATMLFNILS